MRFLISVDKQRTLPLSPPEGSSKRKNAHFPSKSALILRTVCYKVFCVRTVSGKDLVVRHHRPIYLCKKWLVGISPSTYKLDETDQ